MVCTLNKQDFSPLAGCLHSIKPQHAHITEEIWFPFLTINLVSIAHRYLQSISMYTGRNIKVIHVVDGLHTMYWEVRVLLTMKMRGETVVSWCTFVPYFDTREEVQIMYHSLLAFINLLTDGIYILFLKLKARHSRRPPKCLCYYCCCVSVSFICCLTWVFFYRWSLWSATKRVSSLEIDTVI